MAFNNGLIIQWISYQQTAGGLTTYFPIVFPNRMFSIANMLHVISGFAGQINNYIVGDTINKSSIFTWSVNETPFVTCIIIGY